MQTAWCRCDDVSSRFYFPSFLLTPPILSEQSLANIPIFPSTLLRQQVRHVHRARACSPAVPSLSSLTAPPQHLLPNGSRQHDAPPLPSAAPSAGHPIVCDPAFLQPQHLSAAQHDVAGGVAALAPRALSFAPPSPPPLNLDLLGGRQEAAAAGVVARGVGRGRGRVAQAAAAVAASPASHDLPREQIEILTASPLMAPGVSNSPGMANGTSFRVRIGERVITDGLCALLQGMLQPQVSQPPLTANSLLSLLQRMAPPALTLGRTSSPSWLQDNTQQVVRVFCAWWAVDLNLSSRHNQDCHEFLRYLLGCVSDEHALFFDPPQPTSPPPPINPSAIFTGAIVSRVQCKHCGHSRQYAYFYCCCYCHFCCCCCCCCCCCGCGCCCCWWWWWWW